MHYDMGYVHSNGTLTHGATRRTLFVSWSCWDKHLAFCPVMRSHLDKTASKLCQLLHTDTLHIATMFSLVLPLKKAFCKLCESKICIDNHDHLDHLDMLTVMRYLNSLSHLRVAFFRIPRRVTGLLNTSSPATQVPLQLCSASFLLFLKLTPLEALWYADMERVPLFLSRWWINLVRHASSCSTYLSWRHTFLKASLALEHN